MINVIATINLKPGTRDDYLKLFNANVPAVLAEDGCIEYSPTVDIDSKIDAQLKDENTVVVIEKWESLEALHAHLKAPHMAELRKAVKDMVAAPTSLRVLEKG